ncbi:hypothetical protein LTR95_019303, partial [Oleoguttula sp. CCFEE 5521]
MPQDDDLLARLNALKPSTVKLQPTPATSVHVEVSRPQTVEDKLAARLKGLRNGDQAAVQPLANTSASGARSSAYLIPKDTAETLTQQTRDDIATDPISNWQHDDNDQSIDDLLAELETNEQACLDPDDPDDVAKLLREASLALPSEAEAISTPDPTHNTDVDTPDDTTERATDDPAAEDREDDS